MLLLAMEKRVLLVRRERLVLLVPLDNAVYPVLLVLKARKVREEVLVFLVPLVFKEILVFLVPEVLRVRKDLLERKESLLSSLTLRSQFQDHLDPQVCLAEMEFQEKLVERERKALKVSLERKAQLVYQVAPECQVFQVHQVQRERMDSKELRELLEVKEKLV